jgi:hypothetical protein
MKSLGATSVVNYLQLVDTLANKHLFRGQADSSWPVLPSLARKTNELKLGAWNFDSWETIESVLLQEFQRLSSPWLTFTPRNRLEWLVVAQHHGLPTMLLDWTTNPLKGLFFAVEDMGLDHVDGVVYAFEHYNGWSNAIDQITTVEDLMCFFPTHINPRLVNQEACFVAFALPDKLMPFEPLTVFDDKKKNDHNGWLDQVIIPGKAKAALRGELAKMGITHQSLFPGLDGIATTIRRTHGWP